MANNDIGIIVGILSFFIALGVIIPYVQAAFETSIDNNDIAGFNADVQESYQDNANSVTIWKVLLSILAMLTFNWTVPLFIELLIFLPMRIAAAMIIARNIWIGGGG